LGRRTETLSTNLQNASAPGAPGGLTIKTALSSYKGNGRGGLGTVQFKNICRSDRTQMSLLSSGGPGGYSNPRVFLALTGILVCVLEAEVLERAGATGRVGATGVVWSLRRRRGLLGARLWTVATMPASSSSHWQIVARPCPSALAARISGQRTRNWPALVEGFFPRRCARRSVVSAIHGSSGFVYSSLFPIASIVCAAFRHNSTDFDNVRHSSTFFNGSEDNKHG
jgi:hypothetical protein